MTIDGIDIAENYGLRLYQEENYFDLPARKRVLTHHGHTAKDIRYTPKNVVLRLWGRYATKADLGIAVASFYELLKSDVVHEFDCGERGMFYGTATTGARVTIHRNVARVELPLTVNHDLED